MKIREAFKYLEENYIALREAHQSMIGIGYDSNDKNEEFHVISLNINLNDDDIQGDSNRFYLTTDSGNLGESSGSSGLESNENLEELIEVMPDCIDSINFKIHNIQEPPTDMQIEYLLKEIFDQELPDPEEEDYRVSVFKAKAIELITQINSEA